MIYISLALLTSNNATVIDKNTGAQAATKGFRIPYPKGTWEKRIEYNNQIMKTLTPNPWLFDDLEIDLTPRPLPINPKTKQAAGRVNFSCSYSHLSLLLHFQIFGKLPAIFACFNVISLASEGTLANPWPLSKRIFISLEINKTYCSVILSNR